MIKITGIYLEGNQVEMESILRDARSKLGVDINVIKINPIEKLE